MNFNSVRIQIPALALAFAGVLTATAMFSENIQAQSANEPGYKPQHNAKGELILPKNHSWREWPYVGSMVTPNALNGGEAPFPEHHVTYIDPVSWQHYRKPASSARAPSLPRN